LSRFELINGGEAEIRDFERGGAVQEEILGFEVTMAYALSVNIVL
jgi:hypothetical protein